jgi:uncharacterized protein with GYD domain
MKPAPERQRISATVEAKRDGRRNARSQALRRVAGRMAVHNIREDSMPTFILSLNWTDQGIRNIKDGPKRAKAARELAKKVGVDLKQVYLTTGESDLMVIAESETGDNIAKFALSLGALGNVHSRTVRAWPEAEYFKLISELP